MHVISSVYCRQTSGKRSATMTIEQRLDQLEKRNKRFTAALTLMAVAICAVMTVAAAGDKDGEFDTVIADSVYVKGLLLRRVYTQRMTQVISFSR